MKIADSRNDHTIPQEICEQEMNQITEINEAQSLLNNLKDTNNINFINDDNQKILQNMNIALQYEPDLKLGKRGLLCITGENNEHITAKFEFYVYKLKDEVYQELKNKIYMEINNSRKNNQPLTKSQIKGKLKVFNKLLNDKYYCAVILIHNANTYENLAIQSIRNQCVYYPKNKIFSDSAISKEIIIVMNNLHFKRII